MQKPLVLPPCHQKQVLTSARFILDHVLAAVLHRHYVLALPRMLRPCFQHHRHLLTRLCVLAHQCLAEYIRTARNCPKGIPGIILTFHTFGEDPNYHPPLHALVAEAHPVGSDAADGWRSGSNISGELSAGTTG